MKIILFANTDWYLYNFRLPLAQTLIEKGHSVLLLSPPGQYAGRLKSLGFRWEGFALDRSGTNVLREALALLRLWRLYRRERPHLAHHFTVKCVLYGSIAARLAGVSVTVNSITGLGYAFTGQRRGLQKLILRLYRLILRRTWVVFQNPDDRSAFLEKGLVDPNRIALIRGSGVDTDRFRPSPEPQGTPLIILAARLLWDKGVGDFVQAARLMKERGTVARFALVGDVDPANPSSVPLETIKEWQIQNLVEWWGWQENMAEVYRQANLVCLPSYYKEGVPRSLIEAAACGRAIIAADVPGSREIVLNNKNGLLVPVHDPAALADALENMIMHPSTRRKMGREGRRIAATEFDVRQVVQTTLEFYKRGAERSGGINGI